jgi:hypothetical protein
MNECTVALRSKALEIKAKPPALPHWERTGRDGLLFFLRMAHVVTDDSLKEAFVTRDDTLSRVQLDGRNSDTRAQTFWETATEMFNDDLLVYTSIRIPEWSKVFSDSHDLSVTAVRTLGKGAMPIEESHLMAQFRKLNNFLGAVVSRWMASGNGDDMKRKGMEAGEQEVDPSSPLVAFVLREGDLELLTRMNGIDNQPHRLEQ